MTGKTVNAAGAPVPGVCVTIGPPSSCAIVTDAQGNFRSELPNGITFQFGFFVGGQSKNPGFSVSGAGGTLARGNIVIAQ